MGKRDVNESDKSYHPPETIKLDYCAAVLAVVLKHHPEAKDLYENIKDCILLPDSLMLSILARVFSSKIICANWI